MVEDKDKDEYEYEKGIQRALSGCLGGRQASAAIRLRGSGGVGAAILTKAGNLYTGVCIDSACSMGFCAEHAAAAAMVTAGEQEVARMVAVNHQGEILPPCGRCREFISQLAEGNKEAEILVEPDRAVRLRALLPCDWKKEADA